MRGEIRKSPVPVKFNQPSTEIQKEIKSHYDSLKLMARYIDALILSSNNNHIMAANKIIDSFAVNCGKGVYKYQPDRASNVADNDIETQISDMGGRLKQKKLLTDDHGGAGLNPDSMNKVMQEFNQLEQSCNGSENHQDKEYLAKAKNKLKDEGFELPPHVSLKKSKPENLSQEGPRTATDVVEQLRASAASERKDSTTHEGESISYHSSSRGPQ